MDGSSSFRLPRVRLDTTMVPPVAGADVAAGHWTRDAVKARLEEAMATLPAMPGDGPARQARVLWPEMAAERHTDYPDADKPPVRIRPQQAAIGRAEEVLVWLNWLAPKFRVVVSGVALGISLRRIADHPSVRCSHMTVSRWHDQAITCIVARLNGTGIWSTEIPKSA